MIAKPKNSKRNTTNGKRWEDVFKLLKLAGFVELDATELAGTASNRLTKHDRAFCPHWPYTNIYGTKGRHEWYLVANGKCLIVESKWQDVSGSADEKIPFIVENWRRGTHWTDKNGLIYPRCKNWIVCFDGNYWEHKARGKAVVQFARDVAEKWSVNPNRSLRIAQGSAQLADELMNWLGGAHVTR